MMKKERKKKKKHRMKYVICVLKRHWTVIWEQCERSVWTVMINSSSVSSLSYLTLYIKIQYIHFLLFFFYCTNNIFVWLGAKTYNVFENRDMFSSVSETRKKSVGRAYSQPFIYFTFYFLLFFPLCLSLFSDWLDASLAFSLFILRFWKLLSQFHLPLYFSFSVTVKCLVTETNERRINR